MPALKNSGSAAESSPAAVFAELDSSAEQKAFTIKVAPELKPTATSSSAPPAENLVPSLSGTTGSSQPEAGPSGSYAPPPTPAANPPSPLSSVRFHPNLPSTLPIPPPSPGLRAEDRKRKASQDLLVTPLTKESKLDDDTPVAVADTPLVEKEAGKSTPTDQNKQISYTKDAAIEQPDVSAEKAKKKQNAITRTIWTLIMIGGFVGVFPFPLSPFTASLILTSIFVHLRNFAPRTSIHHSPCLRLPDPRLSRGNSLIPTHGASKRKRRNEEYERESQPRLG